MKSLRPILVIILLCYAYISGAQGFAPTGATWTYEVRSGLTGLNIYREWLVAGDTIILGKTCKNIALQQSPNQMAIINPFDSTFNLFVYDSSEVIFWYNKALNNFSRLYDFNLNASDSMVIQVDSCSSIFKLKIDSVRYTTINGQNRKVQYGRYYTSSSIRKAHIIEGIGDLNCCLYPAFEKVLHCPGLIWDGPYYFGLRCYEDSTMGSYNTGLETDCHYYFNPLHELEGIEDVPLQNQAVIYPNPASNIIHFKFWKPGTAISSFRIYNASGQCISNVNSTNELDVSTLPPGLYFIRAIMPGGASALGNFIRQ